MEVVNLLFHFRLWEIKAAAYRKSYDLDLIQALDIHGMRKLLLSLNWIEHESKLKVRVSTTINEVCLAQPFHMHVCKEHAHC